jgi:hypothetical protein
MTYRQAVAEGRRLLKRSETDQWDLAKLTHETVAEGGRGTLTRWAEDLGISVAHASVLRTLWERYGELFVQKHSAMSFNEYYVLAGASPARAARLQENARRRNRRVSVERNPRQSDPREVTRQYLKDRRRMRELLRDPELGPILEDEVRRREAPRRKPARRAPRTGYARNLAAITHGLNELLGEVIDVKLSNEQRRALAEAFEDHETSVGWFGDYLRSGDRSFEDVLDQLREDAAREPVEPPRRRPKAAEPPAQVTERRRKPAPVKAPEIVEAPSHRPGRPRRPASRPAGRRRTGAG